MVRHADFFELLEPTIVRAIEQDPAAADEDIAARVFAQLYSHMSRDDQCLLAQDIVDTYRDDDEAPELEDVKPRFIATIAVQVGDLRPSPSGDAA